MAIYDNYSIPELRELLRLAKALHFQDDVDHWSKLLAEAENTHA